MKCEDCQQELQIGAWPWCPHERGYGVHVIDDQLEGGPRVIDFGGDDHFVSSKSEWRRVLASKPNLMHVDRHDSHYYATKRRLHDQELRETGTNREY